MIDFIQGAVTSFSETQLIITVGNFGISLFSPKSSQYIKSNSIKLFTYLHWNQEQGPKLFGFATELDRTIFLLIIDCPKIGPSIGLSVLSHFTATQFLDIITSHDEQRLSQVNGIGTKKAEQIIIQLKHKVTKLLESGSIKIVDKDQNFAQWKQLSDVLSSLNYSKTEITQTIQRLSKENKAQQITSFDKLIRMALAHLSGTR
jgi:holliday junction DNA helicase RuvA